MPRIAYIAFVQCGDRAPKQRTPQDTCKLFVWCEAHKCTEYAESPGGLHLPVPCAIGPVDIDPGPKFTNPARATEGADYWRGRINRNNNG